MRISLLLIALAACGGTSAEPSAPADDQSATAGDTTPAEDVSTASASNDPFIGLQNEHHLPSGLITSGMPTREALETARDRGVTTVISLRTMEEPGAADEQAMVEELGMTFVSIPIEGAGALTEDNARAVDEAITEREGSTILHCGSSNRAGALVALRAFFVQGVERTEALELGRQAGLSRLEDAVVAAMDGHCEANADAAGC